MLRDLFTSLTELLYGAPLLALGASLVWGMLSILLSPCHLVSIPLIIGYVERQSRASGTAPMALSALFSAGMILAIAMTGLVTGLLGRVLGDIGTPGYILLSLAVVYAGLSIPGWVPLPLGGADAGHHAERAGDSRWGGFLLGLLFGSALGPCTFAFMAPVLGLILALAREKLLFAVGLGAAFALGHGGVVVLAGAQTGRIERLAGWSGRSRIARTIKVISSVLVIVGGLYLLMKALHLV